MPFLASSARIYNQALERLFKGPLGTGGAYPRLEALGFSGRERVRFGDDRDDVDLALERPHALDVQGLHAVAPRAHEVEAAVDAVVGDVAAVEAALVAEELLELGVDVLDDGPEALGGVDGVAEAWRVHDGQAQFDAALLDLHRGRLDLDGGLGVGAGGVPGRLVLVEVRLEEAVDERGLAQARLAHHHQRELEALLDELAVHLRGQVAEAHVAGVARGVRLLERRKGVKLGLGVGVWLGTSLLPSRTERSCRSCSSVACRVSRSCGAKSGLSKFSKL